MDVFLEEAKVFSSNNDESTVLSGKASIESEYTAEDTFLVDDSNNQFSSTSYKEYNNKGNNGRTYIGLIIGILIIALIGIVYFVNNGKNGGSATTTGLSNDPVSMIVDSVEQINNEEAKSSTSEIDIYAERVKEFSQNRKGVIVSYPNDNRYCVYYSKPLNGHKELYRYDALTDKEEKIDLPVGATWGYTDLWLTKNNRFIFIAAEERYTDFIRIDTETKQVMYITECHHVKRGSNGFIVTKSECYNEYEATSMADMLYEYTDYYYDEEGNYTGNHGNTYR